MNARDVIANAVAMNTDRLRRRQADAILSALSEHDYVVNPLNEVARLQQNEAFLRGRVAELGRVLAMARHALVSSGADAPATLKEIDYITAPDPLGSTEK